MHLKVVRVEGFITKVGQIDGEIRSHSSVAVHSDYFNSISYLSIHKS